MERRAQSFDLYFLHRPGVCHAEMSGKGSSGGGTGLSKEDTKTEHPLQAILLCDAWGEEQRWGPLVRRKRTDDEEYEDLPVGGEQRPWVSASVRDHHRAEPCDGIRLPLA